MHTEQMAAPDSLGTVTDFTCSAEDLVDAKLTSRAETLTIIQRLTMNLIQAVANDQDPELLLVRYHVLTLINSHTHPYWFPDK